MEATRGGRLKEPLRGAAERLAHFVAPFPTAVIGGFAIIARVKPRTTDDLDVVIAASPESVPALLQAARAQGYRWDPAHEKDFVEMGLLRLESPLGADGYGLDVILADGAFLSSVVARATPVSFESVVLPVATLEDLVLMKLDANRPADIDDVLSLKDAFAKDLDRAYLAKWAQALGLADRLKLYFEE